MIDFPFLYETTLELLDGIPLTLKLALSAVLCGLVLAALLAAMRLSGSRVLDGIARLYVTVFRGTPLLVQIFIIYYGLGQFPGLRASFVWPYLREPYWCALLALSLNTAAYGAEIIRGGLVSVAHGQLEAARAYGMSRYTTLRRVILPQALRQMLPSYSNEVILMVKATALASTVTLLEVTGIAVRIISETYRTVEVFLSAAVIYLAINFIIVGAFRVLEYLLSPEKRAPKPVSGTPPRTSSHG